MAQTFSLFAMVTVHVADVDGVQFDDHPPKVEPTAVRVTDEPRTKLPVQEAVRDGKVTPPLLFSVNVAFAVTVLPLVEVVSAVIVVLLGPVPTPVASPEELIVATSTSLECQVTMSVMSRVIGLLLNVPMAINCAVSPVRFRSWALGIIVRAVSAPPWLAGTPPVEVKSALAVTGPKDEFIVAVTETVPAAIAVAKPVALTVAMAGLADAQVTLVVMSSV